MGILRTVLPPLVVLAASAVSLPSASAAPAADRLIAGDAAAAGSLLVAGKDGATYQLRGGAVVEFGQGTEFALEPSLRLKLRKPGDPETLTRAIRVVRGTADVTVPGDVPEPTAVLLRGSSKLSVVAKEGRTAFVVGTDETTAAARSGEALVGLGNDWKPMREGLVRTLAPTDPLATPRPIPGTPSVALDHGLLVVAEGKTGYLRATWAKVPEAARYSVKVTGATAAPAEITSETSATLGPLGPGSYFVSVAAIDRHGLAGSASAPSSARVVGLSVPEGAAAHTDGAIVLGRDQRVSLIGALGVEVSYGTSPVFIVAPPALGLARNAPTLVRLRNAASKEEVAIRLEPKALRARVRISPRDARWPTDRIAVDVELYDESGRPVPESVQVDASVTVNMSPAGVKWERSGRVLRTSLPSSSGAGPWVVRAEVKDRGGELLGRDFLEVAPAQARGAAVAALGR